MSIYLWSQRESSYNVMMENHLATGYRFYPTEEELVRFYLQKKLNGTSVRLSRIMDRIIPTLDIYKFNPWELPQFAGEVCQRDPEQWFFFIPRKESEAHGGKPKRLTTFGYWKATGSLGYVYANSSNGQIVGLKRTMVFYNGRAPNGSKTEWKMNEYKVLQGVDHESSSPENSLTIAQQPGQEYSLCRVYKKSETLRAFDRRPTTGGSSRQQLQRQWLPAPGDHHDFKAGRTVSPFNHDIGQPRKKNQMMHDIYPQDIDVESLIISIDTSSPDSSSSCGEIGHNNRTIDRFPDGDDANMLLVDATDALWDWINN